LNQKNSELIFVLPNNLDESYTKCDPDKNSSENAVARDDSSRFENSQISELTAGSQPQQEHPGDAGTHCPQHPETLMSQELGCPECGLKTDPGMSHTDWEGILPDQSTDLLANFTIEEAVTEIVRNEADDLSIEDPSDGDVGFIIEPGTVNQEQGVVAPDSDNEREMGTQRQTWFENAVKRKLSIPSDYVDVSVLIVRWHPDMDDHRSGHDHEVSERP
jgi:hypothetical protein